jgi:hypothetical protein
MAKQRQRQQRALAAQPNTRSAILAHGVCYRRWINISRSPASNKGGLLAGSVEDTEDNLRRGAERMRSYLLNSLPDESLISAQTFQ